MSEHCLPNKARELRRRARDLEDLDDVDDATVLDPENQEPRWQVDLLLEDGVDMIGNELLQELWINDFGISCVSPQGGRTQVLLVPVQPQKSL